MATGKTDPNCDRAYDWRQPAPIARKLTSAIYDWCHPGRFVLAALFFAAPFAVAAFLAPALLSLTPTLDMLSPIADMRAATSGELPVSDLRSPLYAALLFIGDHYADTAGRIHLIAKALSAAIIAIPLAIYASARLPVLPGILLIVALTAFVAAPFAGVLEFGLALLLVLCFACLAPSASPSVWRARIEGALGGVCLFALWMLHPVFSLAGFLALSGCPFIPKNRGLTRYMLTLSVFSVMAIVAEYFAPGTNFARSSAVSAILAEHGGSGDRSTMFGWSGVIISSGVVFAMVMIIGGANRVMAWAPGLTVVVIGACAAKLVGVSALPVFALAASMACFSMVSPFYDGIFVDHDRASISAGFSAGALTLFLSASLALSGVNQFALQMNAIKEAPREARAEFGLVQPGGPTIAHWVEEGRFSAPEARDLFALTPTDQTAMLLEISNEVRRISRDVAVAILTHADTACVIAAQQPCRADGPAAANVASVVLVPRLPLDRETENAKTEAEVLLYTEFKLAEQTALWDIWVRRGVSVPSFAPLTSGQ